MPNQPRDGGSGSPLASPIVIPVSTAAFAEPKAYPCPVAGDFKPVDIPVGLLCDYYEHGVEHAPPRDPSGVMQKRELFYAAPHDPFCVDNSAFAGRDDRAFLAKLESLRSSWERGEALNSAELGVLEFLAARSSLSTVGLLDMGRGMDWALGDRGAAAFFRAGLEKASRENGTPGGGAASPILHVLHQTKALWRLRDYQALEMRFAISRRLSPPLSPEARRAGYLYADVLYCQHKNEEAAAAIVAVQAQNLIAGDLGALDRSDLPEMDWTQGLFLYEAAHFDAAAAYLSPRRPGQWGAHGSRVSPVNSGPCSNRANDGSSV
jgi:hypothetical protein